MKRHRIFVQSKVTTDADAMKITERAEECAQEMRGSIEWRFLECSEYSVHMIAVVTWIDDRDSHTGLSDRGS